MKIQDTLTQFNGAGRMASRGCLNRVAVASLLIAMLLIGAYGLGTFSSRIRDVRAQQPVPSPTPIDQHWRVFSGDIESLELQLHDLNRANVMVPESQITISHDGKRFVIVLYDEPENEE